MLLYCVYTVSKKKKKKHHCRCVHRFSVPPQVNCLCTPLPIRGLAPTAHTTVYACGWLQCAFCLEFLSLQHPALDPIMVEHHGWHKRCLALGLERLATRHVLDGSILPVSGACSASISDVFV